MIEYLAIVNKTEIKIADEANMGIRLTSEINNKLKEVMIIPERKVENRIKEGYEKTTIFNNPILNDNPIIYNEKNTFKMDESLFDEVIRVCKKEEPDFEYYI